MSEEISTASGQSRKEKRAKRDAERAQKYNEKGGKKRKADASIDDTAEGKELGASESVKTQQSDSASQAIDSAVVNAPKKRKVEHDVAKQSDNTSTTVDGETQVKAKKSKKRKTVAENGEEPESRKRFLVFVGNLPYTTTTDSLDKHFAKLKPYTLRHQMDPKLNRSKGFAFIEFENYDRMKTCLKIYHHSTFDPDNPGFNEQAEEEALAVKPSKRTKARKINVELTVGGGGHSKARTEKIKIKNVKLDEQRKRRSEALKKEKEGKRRSGGDDGRESKPESDAENSGEMHPSRLARLQA